MSAPRTTTVEAPPQRCVYGYTDHSFDDAIKPLLLLYLVGSAMGSLVLAVFCQDATRLFALSTGLHLFPEMLVWTHMLFPPLLSKEERWRDKARWIVRTIYGIGWLILVVGPLQPDTGKLSATLMYTYLLAAGTSDCLGVWLGLLMMTARNHRGARRLGASFFCHGLAFHVVLIETMLMGDIFGMDTLQGFGWILLLTASVVAFYGLLDLFKEPLDLRNETVQKNEFYFLLGGLGFSLFGLPALLAAFGYPPDIDAIVENPAFLPRNKVVLLIYKIVFPMVGFWFMSQTLTAYVDAGLPILPFARVSSPSTITTSTMNGKKH